MMLRRHLLALITLCFVLVVYTSVVRTLFHPIIELPDLLGGLPGQTLVFMLFSLTHAGYALGWRHALIFFVLTATISWLYEQVGVATGLIYGPYHYTDVLGLKLGHVPLLIPPAWFMMIYPSYVVANLIASDQPTGSPRATGRTVGVAFLSAAVMTAWDLLADPVLSGPGVQAWIWATGGPYFGIPLQNYVGWMLTTFTIYLSYRLFERQVAPQPIGPLITILVAMPVVAYGAAMIHDMLANASGPLRVIGPFVMGIPLLAAAARLWRNTRSQSLASQSPQSTARACST